MNVAIVHDWLNQIGGAENVLETLVELYPQAPVYTSMYGPELMPPAYRAWEIRTSFMQRWPGVTRHHQLSLPFYPLAFESFDLSSYDLVLSNKSAFCHGVITPAETLHICYCLTPTRFLWAYDAYREREGLGRLADLLLRPLLSWLRLWDRLAADRVDYFISISRVVQQRVRKFYRRESVVIHPPVDTEWFTPGSRSPDDYFLIVSRLIPYKRIDLAVRAFTDLGLPLVVVGDGRDREPLQAMAGPNITFLGRVDQHELLDLVRYCRAFIFPGLEDFGIAPVEAQAAGRPVIAFAGGGALDTVVEGVTGTFFCPQTPEALAEAVQRFDPTVFDPVAIRAHAERFSISRFKRELTEFVEQKYEEHLLDGTPLRCVPDYK
ncbi:MAG TPA: glycosyltransferase family 4 protein, partial [Anaerolineae bacterium]|nr:glycosyltransferase family 4 protein [Anaerolineae bacterium]